MSYSQEYIQQLYRGLREDLWQPTYRQWDRYNRLYDLSFKIAMVESATKIVPPHAKAKIDQAVDQLITSLPAVTRRPLSEGQGPTEVADRIDSWGAFLLANLDRDMALPPFKSFSRHLLMYGYASLFGPRWKDEVWPLLPKRKSKAAMKRRDEQIRGLFPFYCSVPHPKKILLDPFEGKEPPYGFLVTSRTLHALREEYPDKADIMHGNPFDMRQVIAYWSDDQHLVWVSESDLGEPSDSTGVLVLDKDNPYSFRPFLQAFGGRAAEGSGPLNESLARLCQGLYGGVEDSFVAHAEAVTAMGEMVKRFAYQHTFVPEGQEAEIAEKFAQGLIVGVSNPGEIQQEQLPTVPPWVVDYIRERQSDIDSGTYGDVLRGVRPQGVSTASQHAQIVSKAKQVFSVPMQQINDIAGLFLGNCMRLVETYGDPVTVSGYSTRRKRTAEETIKPEDFQGVYQVEVDYAAADPIEQAGKTEQYAALLAAGAIDWETFMRDGLHHPDISEVEKRRAAEAIWQMPAVQQLVMVELQRRWQEKVQGYGSSR